ncbi:MAG TPA: glycosyltransferase [Candidatus Acidoferrales bacterium]|nr:glycosyltransferase [Candidatus Acidoferrales bacterium]
MQCGRALLRAERWQEAEPVWRAVVGRQPDVVEAQRALARISQRQQRWPDAQHAWRAVMRLDPDDVNAVLMCGIAALQLRQLEEALALFTEVRRRAPTQAEAWVRIVQTLRQLGRRQEAEVVYNEAAEQLPRNAAAWRALGRMLDALNRPADAEAHLLRAVDADPNDYHAKLALARHLLQYGYVDRADYWLRQARALAAQDADVARLLTEVEATFAALGVERAPGDVPLQERDLLRVPEQAIERLTARLGDRRARPHPNPVRGRVVLVAPHLVCGGVERQLVNLLRRLLSARYDIDTPLLLIHSLDPVRGQDFFLPRLADLPLQIRCRADIPIPSDPAAIAGLAPYAATIRTIIPARVRDQLLWLAQELHVLRPAVVYAVGPEVAIAASLAGLMTGVPRIVLRFANTHPDASLEQSQAYAEQIRYMKDAFAGLAGFPEILFCNISRMAAEDCARWIGVDPARFHVIYNGVDVSDLEERPGESAALRARLGIPVRASVVGLVARVAAQKDPELWIEVAARAGAARPDAHFVWVGDGPLRQRLEDCARAHGIEGRFHCTGAVERVAPWYRMMDVMLLTSRFEGLCNAVLEAQACGVPVVCSAVGGVPEAVQDGTSGLLVDPPTVEHFVERILWALDHPEWRAAAAQCGPAFIRERFGLDALAQATLAVWGIDPARAPHD